ncbi:uncharacterized protein Triagg1_2790 [Trichoderma aggressivum f. europaeum]|uniref:Uncharacterized protein n=1 Tax=Trichoderma aggressivum f. europaeum TaxID=173218 RepID=A0AAE1IGM2_9HYPO|nr:hypothetical protein Triagg1_2790 [Trichoderma aggressivum f. europaeum]
MSGPESYFLVPALGQEPDSMPLGSVIADVETLERMNPNENLSIPIDTKIFTAKIETATGFMWNGPDEGYSLTKYLAFRRLILGDIEAPLPPGSTIKYRCERIETRHFEPSAEFIANAAANPAVKSRLEIGDSAKVFVVTGIKTAEEIKVKENQKTDTKMHMRGTHGKSALGPTIVAFQVKQLFLTPDATDLTDEDLVEQGMEAVKVTIDGNGDQDWQLAALRMD